MPLLPSSEEGLIQVIGDRKLDKEIRFSVSKNSNVIQGYHMDIVCEINQH